MATIGAFRCWPPLRAVKGAPKEKFLVSCHLPVAASDRVADDAHNRSVQVLATHRAVERSLNEKIPPSAPTSIAPGRWVLGHAHHRRVQVLPADRPVRERGRQRSLRPLPPPSSRRLIGRPRCHKRTCPVEGVVYPAGLGPFTEGAGCRDGVFCRTAGTHGNGRGLSPVPPAGG